MKPLCIYHGNCDDGFAAAWCVRHVVPSAEFFPGIYQQEPPDVTGRDVLIVDFSYKLPVLEQMAETAHSILVIDHHKTAAEDLSGLHKPPPGFGIWTSAAWSGNLSQSVRLCALFDMTRSGAGLTWDYLTDGLMRYPFLDYIEDRDLWRKQLPDGDLFTIALRSYPQEFDIWDGLVAAGPGPLIAEGRSIQRYYRLRVEELKRSAYKSQICSYGCWIANAPYFAASEVAGELCERSGGFFGACYFEIEKGRWQYSLRSRGDFDVSQIARIFGGGGHKNAAGFTVDDPVHGDLPLVSQPRPVA